MALYLSPQRDMTEEETDLFIAHCRDGARASGGAGSAEDDDLVSPPAAAAPAPGDAADAPAFEPAPARRINGWTAWRQRKFIEVLAYSGCVSEAAAAAGVTPRSAYRLRQRPGAAAFDAAWSEALVLASNRLTALAFERAIHGTRRTIWHKGEVVGEERVPSDRLLMYLLQHYDRARYGNLSGFTPHPVPCPRGGAAERLPQLLDTLEDSLLPAESPSARVVIAGDPLPVRDAA